MMPSTPFLVKRLEQEALLAQAPERQRVCEALRHQHGHRLPRARFIRATALATVSLIFASLVTYVRG